MTETESRIVELTTQGLAAPKVRERLSLKITVRSIQRIARKYLGSPPASNNSVLYQIPQYIRPHIVECMRRLGKDPYICEICGEQQVKRCEIHHTKYAGATLYDLQYVCGSCNRARVNMGLA